MFSKSFKWFLGLYLVGFAVVIVILNLVEKGDWVIFLNKNRTGFLDIFFTNWTHLGDGLFALALVIALLFIRYRYAVMFAVISITQAILGGVFKRLIFPDAYRPKKFLRDIYELDFIEGVNVHNDFSFPSGHTMTAFSIAAFAALVTKKPYLGVLLFLYAVLVGFSRNYLSQHFLEDIAAGSFLGVLISVVVYVAFKRRKPKAWMEGSLLKKGKPTKDEPVITEI